MFYKRITLKIENRKNLIALDSSSKFDNWNKEIEMFEALDYCKKWSKYRQWLMSNGRSLTDFS